MENRKFNFIDGKVVLKEDRLVFNTEKFHYLRFWAARRKPREILFENIERCYIDDSGASHGFDSTRPHVIIEHTDGKVKLAFIRDKLIKLQPVIERDEAEELVKRLRELSDGDISGGVKDKSRETSSEAGEENEDKNGFSNSKGVNTVEEYKRTCNECGKTWHSLKKREKKLKRSKMWDECAEEVRACGCNFAAEAQHRRNKQETQSELDSLKECPECGSRNYDEEVIEYEER